MSLKEISKIVDKEKNYLKVLLQRARSKLYTGLSVSLKKEKKVSFPSTSDISFLIPWILYASLFILLSFVTLIISWPQFGQENIVAHSIEVISGYLLNPVTISILISFSILYIIDLYLKIVSS